MPITFEELTAQISQMQPKDAITSHGILREKCVTPLIMDIIYREELVELKGEPGAGYVRVSTEHQKTDGFSVDEQIHRILHHFIEKKQSFVIYNDAAISGFYPPKNERLIGQMRSKHEKRYVKNFEAIFLKGTGAKSYNPEQVKSMRKHMEESVAQIRKSADVVFTDEGVTLKSKSQVNYRPALTELLLDLGRYTTLAVSDLSRLYRNQAIGAEIGDRLRETGYKTKIVGLIENLDFLNGESEEITPALQRFFFSYVAEQQLSTITINSLRGTLEMLEQGKPHAKLPYYYNRLKDGSAVFKPGVEEALMKLVELVMEPDELGRRSYIDISIMMQKQFPNMDLGHKPGEWNRRRITDILSNPCLYGAQRHFGLEFQVYPPIMDKFKWDRLQVILDEAKVFNANHRATIRKITLQPDGKGEMKEKCYLATGLLRCACGGRMCHHPFTNFTGYVCTRQTESKVKKQVTGEDTVRHTRFLEEDVHRFIHDFMVTFKDEISRGQSEVNWGATQTAAAEANALLIDKKLALQNFEQSRSPAMESQFAEEDYEEKDIPGAVRARLNALTKSQRAEILSIQEKRDSLESELARFGGESARKHLNERLAMWPSLTAKEQNAILLTVFDRWEIIGEDPHLKVLPVMKNGIDDWDPIPLITKVQVVRASGRENYTRRFPPVDSYADAISDSRQAQTQSVTE